MELNEANLDGVSGIVGEVETQARVVEKEEVSHNAHLENALAIEQATDHAIHFIERLLHGRVLDGIDPQ